MSAKQTPGLTVRTYGGEEDIRAIAALHNASAQVDGALWTKSEEDLRQRLADPQTRPGENVFLFEVQGQPVAYGHLELEQGPENGVFFTRGLVHPHWRRRGIGRQVMECLEQRARERLPEVTAATVKAGGPADLTLEDRQALYRALDYELVRYFSEMECSLRTEEGPVELPEPRYPSGIVVRNMAQRPDLRAVRQATADAFRGHWEYTELAPEQWEHWVNDPNYRPEFWLVAWNTANDEPVGICLSGVHPERNARLGIQEGWIFVLGVRPPFRRLGLGRALLVHELNVMQAAGMASAALGVDTGNLSGALRLYEQAGFRPVRKYAIYRKVLRG